MKSLVTLPSFWSFFACRHPLLRFLFTMLLAVTILSVISNRPIFHHGYMHILQFVAIYLYISKIVYDRLLSHPDKGVS